MWGQGASLLTHTLPLQCVVIGLQSTGEARTREVGEKEGQLDGFVSAASGDSLGPFPCVTNPTGRPGATAALPVTPAGEQADPPETLGPAGYSPERVAMGPALCGHQQGPETFLMGFHRLAPYMGTGLIVKDLQILGTVPGGP